MLSLLDGSDANAAANNNSFIDGTNSHPKVIKIQQVPTAQEANNVDARSDVAFYPEIKPELKIEIPDGDRSFEEVMASPAAVSENILDKLLLSAAAAGAIDTAVDAINAYAIDPEEAQDWEESLNELFPDLI